MPIRPRRCVEAALAFALLCPHAVAGQGGGAAPRRTLEAGQLRGAPPVVDGRLGDAAWEGAATATGFIQRQPSPGAPASEATEVRVLRGPDAIYVSARLADSRPDSVAAQLGRRDAASIYSDWFIIALDSYNDRRTAFVFGINPRGVKQDLLISDDARGDLSWDAVWEGRARVDSLGWTAELRIPLSQLRFSPGQPAWGLQFQRVIARKNERVLWSPTPPDAPGLVSRFGTLTGLAGIASPARLEVEPYVVTRYTRAPGSAEDPFYRENDLGASLGADLEYGLTPNLTLTATVNPDFGQVEADPSQVNLTAFETLLEEKRSFFVEGMDLFRFGIQPPAGTGGGGEELFYTRRIGRAPQRTLSLPAGAHRDGAEATTILGAAKVTGKTRGGWSLGVLDAVTGEERSLYLLPGEADSRSAVTEPLTNYAVARVRRDLRGGETQVGGILTAVHRKGAGSELDFLPRASYAAGADLRHRFARGTWEAQGWLLKSHVAGERAAVQRLQRAPTRYFQRPDAEHLEYDSLRTSLAGSGFGVGLSRIAGGHWRGGGAISARSPGFEVNDLGFQRDADRVQGSATLGYVHFTPGKRFRSWGVSATPFLGADWSGARTAAGAVANGSFQLQSQWGGSAAVERTLAGVSTTILRGGPAIYVPTAWSGSLALNTDRRKPVSFALAGSAMAEDGTGGFRWSAAPSVDWRPSVRAEVSLFPQFTRYRNDWQYVGAPREQRYLLGRVDQTTAALTMRLAYTVGPNLSLQVYAQPFVSAGEYDEFLELASPRAPRFGERFRPLGRADVERCAGFLVVRSAAGCAEGAEADYRVRDPDFNFKEFRSNGVLRWEYKPGSTLFVVWSQGRRSRLQDGSFDLGRDLGRLFQDTYSPSTNVLLVKVKYWFSR